MSRKSKSLKWGDELPLIQVRRNSLARPEWKLKPTKGSPRATEVNWSAVNQYENNAPEAAVLPVVEPNVSGNNLARAWQPLLSKGNSIPQRLPTANEQLYGLRPTRLPPKATLARLRASRKMPLNSALSQTENGGPRFAFNQNLNRGPVKNTRLLEAKILRDEKRRLENPEAWLSEPEQHQARVTMGSNMPAEGVMLPEYPEVPEEAQRYALNVTKAGFPLKSEYFTPRSWGKWKGEQKGRNWKHPDTTPIPEENGSTTPGRSPNTPGRRKHVRATLEALGHNLSAETPGGTIVPSNNPFARSSGHFSGTPGFFSENNSGTPAAHGGKKKTRKHKRSKSRRSRTSRTRK